MLRAAGLALALGWFVLPMTAQADNCSGLGDCYFTIASAVGVAAGIGVGALVLVFWPEILRALNGFLDPGAGDVVGPEVTETGTLETVVPRDTPATGGT
ncbi:MAG TPA: hypothetical protein PLL45_18515, partial [Thermoflexales bacterium]|nr:hypothetical protein [Thermoflexales bacterium]